MQPTAVDTLIEARWVIPVAPVAGALERHAVAVKDGVIRDVLPAGEARRKYTAAHHAQLENHALIPGLINLHTHAAMTLMRGLADDLPLMEWLKEHIWPAEGRHVCDQFAYDGTLLACAEMLRGGVTCFNDMYFFPAAAARAALDARMRAAIGVIVIEFPTQYAGDAQDYLHKGLAMRDEFKGEPLLGFCMAPHAPYTVSDRTFAQIATYSEQLNMPVHVHVHETDDEIRQSLESHGMRPLARLQQLGLLGPGLIAVHSVHLNDAEIALLARHGCHVAHCPSSNLKLASGIAPVAGLAQQGVNVGLGTDGAASNNRLDLFAEMRLAALLAKAQAGRADALPAHQALRMATLNAARALGLEDRIGSLQAGKAADMVAVDFSGPELAPCYDPVSHLVYAASREHVSHVWVNGEVVVEKGRLTALDVQELAAKANYWQEKLS